MQWCESNLYKNNRLTLSCCKCKCRGFVALPSLRHSPLLWSQAALSHTLHSQRKREEGGKGWWNCSLRNKTWNFYSPGPLIFHWPAVYMTILSCKEGWRMQSSSSLLCAKLQFLFSPERWGDRYWVKTSSFSHNHCHIVSKVVLLDNSKFLTLDN